MTVPAEALGDEYILTLPGADGPVVLAKWIHAGNSHPNSRYRDGIWSLAPLIDSPGSSLIAVHWRNLSPQLLEELKRPTWVMINGELRPSLVETRALSARSRSAASSMRSTCQEWQRLARWMAKHGITSLADLTDGDWRDYTTHRFKNGMSRRGAEHLLADLTDLWAFDQLCSTPAGVSCPPWQHEGVDDYLPEAGKAARGENATEPLDARVMGPLLIWAIRMVEDFGPDILAAWAENRRLTRLAMTNTATPAAAAEIRGLLLPLIETGQPVPAFHKRGKPELARYYLAALTGASLYQLDGWKKRHNLTAYAAQNPGPCPLDVPVTGRIDGRPWREVMDFHETPYLMRHLGTAAAVVCLYLTGMRPQEVQALRSGCCPDPEPNKDGTPARHLIRSLHFKNVTNDDGHYISAGEQREVPWVAITPVVNAIRVLEQMVPPGELLLATAHHDFQSPKPGRYGSLRTHVISERIDDFIAWANSEAERHGLTRQSIADDPHGTIGTSRFRRTLAWHVARRPGGLVALAIQYGHMRTVLDARTSTGYGSRARTGIHGVLDIETALAAADTAAELHDRLAAGEKISGPAARRAVTAAATAPRFEGRLVKKNFAKQSRDYLERDGLVLFDNPDACLMCVFKRDTALCDPPPDATAPNRHECRPGCGNAVRTDTDAQRLRERAATTEELAATFPEPVARRLRATAARDRADADVHDATAKIAQDLT
uniref:Integrase n=1 Tax=Streptomyces sp. NBC_00003 TaxID=2903608 RepID=A0AAU2VC39_9ACTN